MDLKAADLLLVNGNVITMETELPKAQAVGVKGEVLVFVGDNKEALQFKGRQTEVIDLRGKTLIPGFIESHMHPLLYGSTLLEVDCGGEATRSLDNLLHKIAGVAAQTPLGKWIKGWGWDDSKFKERRNPTRWDLDRITPKHPVFLKRACGHIVVVNSLALELSKIDADTPDPEGGHIDKDPLTGVPTGILQERAQEMVSVPPYSIDEYKTGFLLAQQEFAERGITTVHDMTAEANGLKTCQHLLQEKKLTVRMRYWPFARTEMGFRGQLNDLISLGMESGYGNDLLRFQGVKFLLDGSMGGRTAAVTEPYENDAGNCGILYCSEESLTPDVSKALQAGIRVSIHAIGERAIEVALKALEKAGNEVNVAAMRNRIEHCAIPTDAQIERIKKLNVVVGSSLGFIYFLGDSYYYNLGPERVKRAFPQRIYLQKGIVAPGNSDCPVCNVNPLLGIYGAVTRKTMGGHSLGIEQGISPLEALRAYTLDAAYASFDENKIGSLKVNKFADLAVLAEDPSRVAGNDLKDIQVVLTVMNGKITYERV